MMLVGPEEEFKYIQYMHLEFSYIRGGGGVAAAAEGEIREET